MITLHLQNSLYTRCVRCVHGESQRAPKGVRVRCRSAVDMSVQPRTGLVQLQCLCLPATRREQKPEPPNLIKLSFKIPYAGLAPWWSTLNLQLQTSASHVNARSSSGCSSFDPVPCLWPRKAPEDGPSGSCTHMGNLTGGSWHLALDQQMSGNSSHLH